MITDGVMMGMFGESPDFECDALKTKTVTELEDIILTLRSDDTLRVQNVQSRIVSAVEPAEHNGDTV